MKTLLRFTFILFSLSAMLLSACAPAPQTPAATEEAAQPTPIVLEDDLGRTVTLEAPPSRIVIAGFANLMLVDEAYLFPEALTKVAAIAKSGQGNDFLYLVEPKADEKLVLEGDAGPEQIATVNPDLIIIKDSMAKKLGAAVEGLGVPVVYLSSETPEGFFQDIQRFGVIFQNEARAQEIISFYQERMQHIEDAVSKVADDDKPSVLFLQYSTKGGEISYNVPPADWMQTTMLKLAGGAPVWLDAELGSRWTVVGLEQVAVWNPEQIYIVDYFGDTNEAIKDLQGNPLTQSLQAVQNSQIFAVPRDFYSWDQPDPRWILCLTWMATQTHPDLFTDLEMENEVYDFYGSLYNLDKSVVSEQILPLITLPATPLR